MKKIFGAALIALLTAGAANAAVFTRMFNLDVASFDSFGSSATPPITSYSGSFIFSFDTNADKQPALLGSDLGLPSPYGTNIKIAYRRSDDTILIGQRAQVGGVFVSPNTLASFIHNASSSAPTLAAFTLTNQDAMQFSGTDLSLTFLDVPEPATWAMFLAGFGLAGWALRSRRRGTIDLA